MGSSNNIFRFAADLSHLASVFLLIGALQHNRSAAGVSLKTQLLYLIVFATRYLDLLFWLVGVAKPAWWVVIGKLTFLSTSALIVHLVGHVYKTSYDKWLDTLRMRYIMPPCFILALYAFFVTTTDPNWNPFFKFVYHLNEYFWTYSVIQESVAVLPQLVLLTRTGDRTVLNSNYLLALGAYRGLYILNWLYRWAVDGYTDGTALLFGTIQTVLYIDFVIVYRRRQQVSFDNSVVTRDDAENSGILLKYVLRSKLLCPERDENGRPLHVPLGGYSVSANLPPANSRDPYNFTPSPASNAASPSGRTSTSKPSGKPPGNSNNGGSAFSPMNDSPKRPSGKGGQQRNESDRVTQEESEAFVFDDAEVADRAASSQRQDQRSRSPDRGVL